jgi:uncharacterized protein YwgA
MNSGQRTWVAASVKALQEAGSWTGRIHIHKQLFILQVLGMAEIPFEFELYQYGPYSFDLDNIIGEMETYGELEKYYPKAGYGPRYRLTGNNEPVEGRLSEEQLKRIQESAGLLSPFNSNDLELIATCLWAQDVEGLTGEEEIVSRVKLLKPKYATFQIQQALTKAGVITKDIKAQLHH